MLFNHGLRAALVVRYCKVCYYAYKTILSVWSHFRARMQTSRWRTHRSRTQWMLHTECRQCQ